MRFTTILVFLLIACAAIAQNRYMAYSVQGNVTYSLNNKQQQLKIGKILDESKTVKVNKDASLTLICESSSSSVTLKEGTHNLSNIAVNCNVKDGSISGKYFQYVWQQMTQPGESRPNNGGQGAVTRGCPGLDFLSPDTINYYIEPVVLRWKTKMTDKKFVLYMNENSTIPYLEAPIAKKDFFVMDSVTGKLERSISYKWTVWLNGKEECDKKLLQVWSTEDFSELETELRGLLVPGTAKAEQDYMMGFLFETNHFYGEAWKYYRQAAKAEPGNNRYKETVKRFNKIFRTT